MKESSSKENNIWEEKTNKLFSESFNTINNFSFISANSGRNVIMEECLYDDLLPYTVRPSPISSLSGDDDVWIASSMLSRVSEFTSNIVVMDKEFPIGIIGGREILKGILDKPTADFFTDTFASEIMNRKFYLDTRKAKLTNFLLQMKKTEKTFAMIQNSKDDYSGISFRELLEIGSMSKANSSITNSKRKQSSCKREDTVKDLFELLILSENNCLVLEGESVIIDHRLILEKIVTDLNYLNGIDDFLELNTSIFRFDTPKLIPEKLSFPEICKVMLEMKNPYVMTPNRIWTPSDVLDVLISGAV